MKVIVGQIVLARTPFEIIHMVVCLVFILMVNHWQIVRVTDESLCDKPMNEKRLRFIVSPEHDAHVLILPLTLLHHYTLYSECARFPVTDTFHDAVK
jgi:hypothetical protein